jgi:predicted nucleotide-binding protein
MKSRRRQKVTRKGRHRVVLIADDDLFVRNTIREKLRDRNIETIEAGNEAEAKRIIRSRGKDIDVALLDIRMPSSARKTDSDSDIGRRSGLRVARAVKEKNPNTRIIGMSFFEDPESRDWFSEYGHAFLRKTDILESRTGKAIDIIEEAAKKKKQKKIPQCFIVHGHDTRTLRKLINYIRHKLGWKNPKVLRDLPSLGRTIIEKFEDASQDIDIVFVLLTPDDKAAPLSAPNLAKRRARQNVIFELGYFFAKLQRTGGRVILLHKGKVELPSDISGIIYIAIDRGIEAADESIKRELTAWL